MIHFMDHEGILAMKRGYTLGKLFFKWQVTVGIIILVITPFQAMAGEEYRFERMWPTLQQPWYFYSPFDIALDADMSLFI